jgi:hypothetical protein
MGKIVLAPRAARLFDGRPSPKDYPWWPKVVQRLNEQGHEIIQIGVVGEERIEGVAQCLVNWPLASLKVVVEQADCFLTVDSFLPHFVFAQKINTRGVVIWAQSDPAHWGHSQNINLLKDRKFLRERQYQGWMDAQYNEEAFVSPEEVIDAVNAIFKSPNRARTVSASV